MYLSIGQHIHLCRLQRYGHDQISSALEKKNQMNECPSKRAGCPWAYVYIYGTLLNRDFTSTVFKTQSLLDSWPLHAADRVDRYNCKTLQHAHMRMLRMFTGVRFTGELPKRPCRRIAINEYNISEGFRCSQCAATPLAREVMFCAVP